MTRASAQGSINAFFKPVKPIAHIVEPARHHAVPMSKSDIKMRPKVDTINAQNHSDIRKFFQPIEGQKPRTESIKERAVKKRKIEIEGCIDPNGKRFLYPMTRNPYKCRIDEHNLFCFRIQDFYIKVVKPLPPGMKSAKVILCGKSDFLYWSINLLGRGLMMEGFDSSTDEFHPLREPGHTTFSVS